jgi:hypothetical protein
MSKHLLGTLLLGALVISDATHAAAFSCNVDVQRVLVYSEGTINVRHSGASNFTYICNIRGFRNGVSPEVCLTWKDLLITAQTSARQAAFYYDVPDAVATSCATLPTYADSPAPLYVGLR